MLKNNTLYFIWCGIYITLSWLILGATWRSFFITIVSYSISITIALSPIGEAILRLMEGARRPATKKEKEYLITIFNEVYEKAKAKDNRLSDKIQLYVTDKMYINACAIGKNTICLTRGAVEVFTEDELRGVLSHEFGHISNGDTIALLLNVVGNGIFTILIMIERLAFSLFELFGSLVSWFNIVIMISRMFFDFIVLVVLLIGEIILSINSRKNEYLADRFGYEIGYGEELIRVLYILQNTAIPSDMKLIDRLRQSPPHLAYRIEKLETAQDEEDEQTADEI